MAWLGMERQGMDKKWWFIDWLGSEFKSGSAGPKKGKESIPDNHEERDGKVT